MVRHPPAFNPEEHTAIRRAETQRRTNTLSTHQREEGQPGAVAHEDTFPYGQSAVVPHQQKVEDFISDAKHTQINTQINVWRWQRYDHVARRIKICQRQFLPIVEKEEAGYCSKHQDYGHIQLELFIFVLVGESKGTEKLIWFAVSRRVKHITYFAWLLRSVTFTLPNTKFKYSLKRHKYKHKKWLLPS